jgi:hypothetical protein
LVTTLPLWNSPFFMVQPTTAAARNQSRIGINNVGGEQESSGGDAIGPVSYSGSKPASIDA